MLRGCQTKWERKRSQGQPKGERISNWENGAELGAPLRHPGPISWRRRTPKHEQLESESWQRLPVEELPQALTCSTAWRAHVSFKNQNAATTGFSPESLKRSVTKRLQGRFATDNLQCLMHHISFKPKQLLIPR